ncbi:hypothetical protein CDAR_461121 [Caerostris darwini]|uniref:Uncharacterized protein n=1 Tax=Caerostris darwini TaxID=1538125 RepID=A0AAV4Q4B2_9ARAC|nr:hypothetical protein CDAR_461121 [Caerostris darwini]
MTNPSFVKLISRGNMSPDTTVESLEGISRYVGGNSMYIVGAFKNYTQPSTIVPPGEILLAVTIVKPRHRKEWRNVMMLYKHQGVLVCWRAFGENCKTLADFTSWSSFMKFPADLV